MWLAASDGKSRAKHIVADNSEETNQSSAATETKNVANEVSKRETAQLALIDLYKSENDRLKQDIEKLGHLWPRFHAEYEHFKAEVARLTEEVARLKQEMDTGGGESAQTDCPLTDQCESDEEEDDVLGDLKSELENDLDHITNIRLDLEEEIAKEQATVAEEVRKMDDSTDSVVGTKYIEETTISGLFVKVANMFEDEGFFS
jgi:hypothetical protein